MARIRYDQYLYDADYLYTITNADTEYLTNTVPESFTNPPIKLRFLNTGDKNFERLCLDAVNDDEITIPKEDVLRMVRGQLSGWRLVGAQFSPTGGFSAYYANERPTLPSHSNASYNYGASKGISFYFVERRCLEVELEVDYGDGLPTRHYVGNVTQGKKGITCVVTEYWGKRKIRKVEFSEEEHSNTPICGHLCHITEY